ncbi:unnamed protein product [Clonostachys byssicola]|uniref:Uncharacterized protein n=1 Tax=Clonostachys byssicola TaxID=160290 RepID=A0A9N9UXE5_9HYPO|nr:unnamed protein product [Clonostachys byssicola]
MRPYDEEAWFRMKMEYPKYSRAYIGILNVLASAGNKLKIEELSIQSNGLRHGLIAHFFNQVTPEYHDFVAMLSRTTFRRLDLVLTTESQNRIHWPAFRSGHLRHALGQAVNLQHFSLTADLHTVRPSEDNWTALDQIIPADLWPLLRSFRLMDFLVKQDDLVTFLGTLPLSVRTIELGQLEFVPENGDYATLLDLIKHELHWSDRQVAKQPRLTIIVAISDFAPPGMMNWIDSEVQEFIYYHGRNPFRGLRGPVGVDAGVGVERDMFNPDYEWPHQDDFDWEREVKRMREKNHQLFMDLQICVDRMLWPPAIASMLEPTRDDDDVDGLYGDTSFDLE